jgi:hypothetical protein
MKVYKDCCKNCLLSADAIVSAKRRKEIIKTCSQEQSHFICHKASERGEDVCCKSFYENLGHTSQMVRIAQRLDAVQFVEQPESEKFPSHREMSVGK